MAGSSARIAAISKRRTTLKRKITNLTNLVVENKVDRTNAKLRLANLTVLFHAYEELHEELSELDPENEKLERIRSDLENDFYSIASLVEDMPGAGGSGNPTHPSFGHSTFVEKQRLLKLPVAELPKFNGDHNMWLSYRNTFVSMIDMRTDIDDLNKFLYLKSSLQGPALSKIFIYDTSAENYKLAWKLLTDTYDKKRVLVSKHLYAILDTAPITLATSNRLSKLIDDTRQHLNQLASLGVAPEPRLTLAILERSLPNDVRQEWEKALDVNTLPDLDQFYLFIENLSYRLASWEQAESCGKTGFSGKRHAERDMGASKMRKNETGARALVTTATTSVPCIKCGNYHAIFKCPVYDKLAVQQRWDFIKTNNLCRNCLRSHDGKCNSTNCKLCDKRHHTSLHANPKSKTNPKSEQVKPTSR